MRQLLIVEIIEDSIPKIGVFIIGRDYTIRDQVEIKERVVFYFVPKPHWKSDISQR